MFSENLLTTPQRPTFVSTSVPNAPARPKPNYYRIAYDLMADEYRIAAECKCLPQEGFMIYQFIGVYDTNETSKEILEPLYQAVDTWKLTNNFQFETCVIPNASAKAVVEAVMQALLNASYRESGVPAVTLNLQSISNFHTSLDLDPPHIERRLSFSRAT